MPLHDTVFSVPISTNDVYPLHQAVWTLFGTSLPSRNFLYTFLETGNETIVVLRFKDGKPANWKGKIFEQPIPTAQTEIDFALRANPVKRSQPPAKRVIPLLDEDSRRKWLERKLHSIGAELVTVHAIVSSARVSKRDHNVNDVLFHARCKITDKSLFAHGMRDGIGKSKGYGFGMLSLEGSIGYKLLTADARLIETSRR